MPSVKKYILKGKKKFLILVEPSGRVVVKLKELNYVGKPMFVSTDLETAILTLNEREPDTYSEDDLIVI